MPYITQTKQSIQSTNVNTNDTIPLSSYNELFVNVSIAWNSSEYMDT